MNICIMTGILCMLLAGRRLIQLIQLRTEEENLERREREKVEE